MPPFDERTEAVKQDILQGTCKLLCVGVEPQLPAPSPEQMVRQAAAIRKRMEELTPDRLCAVCSCGCPRGSVKAYPTDALLPRLNKLLRCDGAKAPQHGLPRDALTRTSIGGVDYCLQPLAVHADGSIMDVCDECMDGLKQDHVPMGSLVRFDTGTKPAHLEWPTLIEECCIGLWRPFCMTVLCAPGKKVVPGTAHLGLKGHVTAFPNPTPQQLMQALPLPPERLSEFINVILMTPVSNLQQLKERARRCEALKVRGSVVAGWARHLATVYPQLALNDALVRRYEAINDVPDELFTERNTVYATNEADAAALRQAHTHLREGFADPE